MSVDSLFQVRSAIQVLLEIVKDFQELVGKEAGAALRSRPHLRMGNGYEERIG